MDESKKASDVGSVVPVLAKYRIVFKSTGQRERIQHGEAFAIEATNPDTFIKYRTVVSASTLKQLRLPVEVSTARKIFEAALKRTHPEIIHVDVGFVLRADADEKPDTAEGAETPTESKDFDEYIARLQEFQTEASSFSDSLVVKLTYSPPFVTQHYWYLLPAVNHDKPQELLRTMVQAQKDEIAVLREELATCARARAEHHFAESKLVSAAFAPTLKDWLYPYKVDKLIFRASDFDLIAAAFHGACDYRGPTVVVAKADHSDKVFGGFASKSWTSSGAQVISPNSYIFNETRKFDFRSGNHFYDVASVGPCFGTNSHDLHVSDGGHNSSSNPQSFVTTNTELCGAASFKVVEYEVFTVSAV